MSMNLRAMLERGELDAAMVQIFDHVVRPGDVILYREALHWVKHPDLVIRPNGPVPSLSFHDDCFYRQWAFDIGRDEALLEPYLSVRALQASCPRSVLEWVSRC